MKTGARASVAGLVALVAFHMREALFEGRVYFERDLHLQWYGQMESFARSVATGAWPLWDPYVGFGQPLLANANAQVLYPLTWLNLVMTPERYYTLYLFAHLMLAALGVRALARRWGTSPAGSCVAAALFVCSGPLLSLGNVWNHLAGAALLPWILLAADRAKQTASPRAVVVLAAWLALGVLAGSPDFLLLAAPVLLGLTWTGVGDGGPPLRKRLAALALAGVLAAGLSAAQFLPSMELVLHSSRANLATAARDYWSVHPAFALQQLVPLAWDDAAIPAAWRAAFFESREPYLFSLYLGAPALFLAALGAARGGHRHRGLLLLTLGLALLLALGRHTPFYPAAAALLPPLRMMRYPAKAMLLVSMAVALLAGAGFDARPRLRVGRTAGALGLLAFASIAAAVSMPGHGGAAAALLRLAGLAIVLAALAFLGKRPGRAGLVAAAVAALGIGDLALFHRDLNPTAPGDFYRVRPKAFQALPAGDTERVYVFDYAAMPGLAPALLGRPRADVVVGENVPRERWRGAMGARLYPTGPVNAGFQVAGSFGRDVLGIQPAPLVKLNTFALQESGAPEWPRVLAAAGVGRLVALHENALGADVPVRGRFHGPYFEDELLYDVPGGAERCRVVSGVRQGDEPALLVEPGFDARQEVLLPEGPMRPAQEGFVGSCEITELRADAVVARVDASAPGLVVVSDAWDPGWKARVDGADVDLLRADVAFRAVRVGAGSHDVRLRYRPASVIAGAWIGAASLALACAVWVRAGRTRRA